MFGLSEDDLQAIDLILEGHCKEFDLVIAGNKKEKKLHPELDAWLTDVAYEGGGG